MLEVGYAPNNHAYQLGYSELYNSKDQLLLVAQPTIPLHGLVKFIAAKDGMFITHKQQSMLKRNTLEKLHPNSSACWKRVVPQVSNITLLLSKDASIPHVESVQFCFIPTTVWEGN